MLHLQAYPGLSGAKEVAVAGDIKLKELPNAPNKVSFDQKRLPWKDMNQVMTWLYKSLQLDSKETLLITMSEEDLSEKLRTVRQHVPRLSELTYQART